KDTVVAYNGSYIYFGLCPQNHYFATKIYPIVRLRNTLYSRQQQRTIERGNEGDCSARRAVRLVLHHDRGYIAASLAQETPAPALAFLLLPPRRQEGDRSFIPAIVLILETRPLPVRRLGARAIRRAAAQRFDTLHQFAGRLGGCNLTGIGNERIQRPAAGPGLNEILLAQRRIPEQTRFKQIGGTDSQDISITLLRETEGWRQAQRPIGMLGDRGSQLHGGGDSISIARTKVQGGRNRLLIQQVGEAALSQQLEVGQLTQAGI